MKIVRFNTISSLPNVMELQGIVIPCKDYEPSIVDKSCFTTLDDQLAKCTPMTASEVEQHYDFINGRDDGRKAPPRQGSDIAEISTALNDANDKLKKQIAEASKKTRIEAEHKAKIDAILSGNNQNN